LSYAGRPRPLSISPLSAFSRPPRQKNGRPSAGAGDAASLSGQRSVGLGSVPAGREPLGPETSAEEKPRRYAYVRIPPGKVSSPGPGGAQSIKIGSIVYADGLVTPFLVYIGSLPYGRKKRSKTGKFRTKNEKSRKKPKVSPYPS